MGAESAGKNREEEAARRVSMFTRRNKRRRRRRRRCHRRAVISYYFARLMASLKWRIKIDARLLLEGGRRSRAILSNPQKKPSRRGISVSWPFDVVGSFPSRGAPSLPVHSPVARRFLPVSLADSLIGESTWRWLSSPAILAGRRRWWSADDTLCIARETRLRDPRVWEWPRGGREICEDEVYQSISNGKISTIDEELIFQRLEYWYLYHSMDDVDWFVSIFCNNVIIEFEAYDIYNILL